MSETCSTCVHFARFVPMEGAKYAGLNGYGNCRHLHVSRYVSQHAPCQFDPSRYKVAGEELPEELSFDPDP